MVSEGYSFSFVESVIIIASWMMSVPFLFVLVWKGPNGCISCEETKKTLLGSSLVLAVVFCFLHVQNWHFGQEQACVQ